MATTTTRARVLTRISIPAGIEGRHRQWFKDSAECAHHWSAHRQREGRSGNTYFRDGVFYSYGSHFPAAAHHVRKGARLILVTTRTYSSSTAGHMADVRRALHGSAVPVYRVDNVLAESAAEHRENFRAMEREASEMLAKSERARGHALSLLDAALDQFRDANLYAESVGLTNRATPPSAEDVAARRIIARDRVRVAEDAAEERSRRYRERWEREQQEREQREAAAVAKWSENLAAWQDLRSNDTPGRGPGWQYEGFAFVRVRGRILETSWSASVPLAAVLPVLAVIRGTADPASLTGEIGPFGRANVDVSAGIVTVGCHRVKFEEIERAAKAAGL